MAEDKPDANCVKCEERTQTEDKSAKSLNESRKNFDHSSPRDEDRHSRNRGWREKEESAGIVALLHPTLLILRIMLHNA